MHVTVIKREGTIIMEKLWYMRTGLYTISDWENMSQPGMDRRSGVYTYNEWSRRTCLNQEWNGGVVFIRVLGTGLMYGWTALLLHL
jgi:hypothetical protein